MPAAQQIRHDLLVAAHPRGDQSGHGPGKLRYPHQLLQAPPLLGGGLAVAAGAPAAIAAASEDPKSFGKSLIFVALGEGIALYGMLIAILIWTKV